MDSNICHLNIGEIATIQGKAIYFLPKDKFAELKILKIKVETTAVKNNWPIKNLLSKLLENLKKKSLQNLKHCKLLQYIKDEYWSIQIHKFIQTIKRKYISNSFTIYF